MYCSIWQRNHSLFVPEWKFCKMSVYSALTTYNESWLWDALIWGYRICNEEAKALMPHIKLQHPIYENVTRWQSNKPTSTVKKASTETSRSPI